MRVRPTDRQRPERRRLVADFIGDTWDLDANPEFVTLMRVTHRVDYLSVT